MIGAARSGVRGASSCVSAICRCCSAEADLGGDHRQRVLVVVAEPVILRAFDIEHAGEAAARHDRHRELATSVAARPGRAIWVSRAPGNPAAGAAFLNCAAVEVIGGKVGDPYRRALARGHTDDSPRPTVIYEPTPDT